MSREDLRRLLYNTMKQCTFMMDHNLIQRSLQKMKAVHELRERFDFISSCSLHVHYRWILKLRNQVIDILPPDGRYSKQRKRILDLLNEAEKTINADYRQRILVR